MGIFILISSTTIRLTMKLEGKHYQTIWVKAEDPRIIQTFDQRTLPFVLQIIDLKKPEEFIHAIKEMVVRGAPLIGVTAAYGIYSATLQPGCTHTYLEDIAEKLANTRPTAVDLFHAIERVTTKVFNVKDPAERSKLALLEAEALKQESIDSCKAIGRFGLEMIEKISQDKNGNTVNILTHCNAGWLACIDYGTATAPIYMAHDKGIKVHVWVDETRPRNQGSRLTAFELGEHGVPHTVIADNTGGHLMQHDMVDMVIVGTDRTTRRGDVANKIGTYLKALAANDNGIPFYVALPSSTIDWNIKDGLKEIPIETRDQKEIKYMEGWNGMEIDEILITPHSSHAANYGFDVTPARLVTGLITEKGICEASEEGLIALFPEKNNDG